MTLNSATMQPSEQAPKLLPQELLAHWRRMLQLCLRQSEQAVADLLPAVAELSALCGAAHGSAALLARLNEGLQFQDRQRQTLELLLIDLNAAMALSPQQAQALDMEAWLDHFEAHCPLPELRRGALAVAGALAAQGDGSPDYF